MAGDLFYYTGREQTSLSPVALVRDCSLLNGTTGRSLPRSNVQRRIGGRTRGRTLTSCTIEDRDVRLRDAAAPAS